MVLVEFNKLLEPTRVKYLSGGQLWDRLTYRHWAGHGRLAGTNTLAYYEYLYTKSVKGFITLGAGLMCLNKVEPSRAKVNSRVGS